MKKDTAKSCLTLKVQYLNTIYLSAWIIGSAHSPDKNIYSENFPIQPQSPKSPKLFDSVPIFYRALFQNPAHVKASCPFQRQSYALLLSDAQPGP